MHEVFIPHMHLGRIAESGQCFRMTRQEGGAFSVPAMDRHVMVHEVNDSTYAFDCSEDEFRQFWHPYFDLDTNYGLLQQSVPRDDAFLQAALQHSHGMRILRQHPWEMLISFILSQRKSIPAIRGCVDKLCARFGQPIGDSGIYSFPSPEALALADEGELNNCGLGYRTRYIKGTARMVAEGEIDLAHLGTLPDGKLQESLCLFPGVGVKVAQCVMLFGYARRSAFPRDVWIQRVEQAEYGGRFPEENYPLTAGILQQYMFFFGKSKEYIHWKEHHG